MLQAAGDAVDHAEGLSKEQFFGDKRTQQAVILNLVIIGEVATRLLKEHEAFLQRHPDIPWRGMKGMRNRIAHGYFEINLEVVWDTIQTAVPRLLERLPDILGEAGRDPRG
jgi:uncharacterized protein with HEPN domain